MKQFFGILSYEYRMSIARRSLWLIFGLLLIPYLVSLTTAPEILFPPIRKTDDVWLAVGMFAAKLNLFLPVVGGIALSDRLVRDRQLGVDEILRSSGLSRRTYVLGKYFGGLFSILTPVALVVFSLGFALAALGASSWISLWAACLAFLGINLPAYAFLTAFSLACPLVMPLRVYQILFTGYWVWGNFLDPSVIPTLNGTLLTASGEYVLAAFFGGKFRFDALQSYTTQEAFLNLALLAGCAFLALTAAEQILTWNDHRV